MEEQTFITIHNLAPDANIIFASASIHDILGYQPHEVLGRSCFDYFHPEELPFARSVHSRGVLLDKAAVLHYVRIRSRDGQWVHCECCFTIVHDVLVASVSIYRRGEKSERRALEAPAIRRIFSSSPRDPRYHMLEHLSPKFKMPPMEREPRAALILNRFTWNATIMFATDAVSSILGVSPQDLKDVPFYECILENCVDDAKRCLESAKSNDSIAYLRFWSRNPLISREDEMASDDDDDDYDDDEEGQQNSCSDSESGGAQLYDSAMDLDGDDYTVKKEEEEEKVNMDDVAAGPSNAASSSSAWAQRADRPQRREPQSYDRDQRSGRWRWRSAARRRRAPTSHELEAVVSCTSDGLVVILRRARPPIPASHPPRMPVFDYQQGLFAAPWGQQPFRSLYPYNMMYHFQPPLLPQYMPLREKVVESGGPANLEQQLMRAIREVAVFAWALGGINGSLVNYSHGQPGGEAQPHDGLPVWDPNSAPPADGYRGPENQAVRRWAKRAEQEAQQASYSTPAQSHAYSATGTQISRPTQADQGNSYDNGNGVHQPPMWRPRSVMNAPAPPMPYTPPSSDYGVSHFQSYHHNNHSQSNEVPNTQDSTPRNAGQHPPHSYQQAQEYSIHQPQNPQPQHTDQTPQPYHYSYDPPEYQQQQQQTQQQQEQGHHYQHQYQEQHQYQDQHQEEQQHHHHQQQHFHHHTMPQRSYSTSELPAEPWADASSTPLSPYGQDVPVATTQAAGASGDPSSQGFQFGSGWQ